MPPGPRPYPSQAYGTSPLLPKPRWQRTPWWVFWRPKWRLWVVDEFGVFRTYAYSTDQQLARKFLKENFDATT